MAHQAALETPQMELTSKVTTDRIYLQAILRSRSKQPVAIVDHEDFVTWRVESASSAGKVTSCGFKPWQRAEWNQVKIISSSHPVVLEKKISYHRNLDGWVLGNATGGRNQLDYLAYNPKLKLTFQYSVDRGSLPLFWWLSGKRFLATPLEASQTFRLNP
jgi:hypothetical protein